MQVKVLMRWDIESGKESDYYDFVVNEFIPRVQRLGLSEMQFWYTAFGECEQIQASGIADSKTQMLNIVSSDEWEQLIERLGDYVSDFRQKLIPASKGFQL